MTLFLTAFDTTSTALTWTWYLLSQNPEAEAELHEELDRVLNGRLPTAEDHCATKIYTNGIRRIDADSILLHTLSPARHWKIFQLINILYQRGSIILMSPYLIHHDPRFHPDPEKFDPHAWDEHSHGLNSKYEYFPFSRGPRSCIGEPFAWMQGILVLATIAQSWRMKLVPDHPVELLPLINLRPKYGMMMTLHRRK